MQKKKIYGVFHKEYDENDSPVWILVYCVATEEKAHEMINAENIPQMYIIEKIDFYE